MDFHVTSKTVLNVKKTFNFPPDHVFQCSFYFGARTFLTFFWSLSHASGARNTNSHVRHDAREHRNENVGPRKAEVQSWGTLRDRQCPSEHYQLPNIHRRLTAKRCARITSRWEEMLLLILGIRYRRGHWFLQGVRKSSDAFMLHNK